MSRSVLACPLPTGPPEAISDQRFKASGRSGIRTRFPMLLENYSSRGVMVSNRGHNLNHHGDFLSLKRPTKIARPLTRPGFQVPDRLRTSTMREDPASRPSFSTGTLLFEERFRIIQSSQQIEQMRLSHRSRPFVNLFLRDFFGVASRRNSMTSTRRGGPSTTNRDPSGPNS